MRHSALFTAALLLNTAAFAGGPDVADGMGNHVILGFMGGPAVNTASLEGTYQNIANTRSEIFNTTASSISLLVGPELGYSWSINPRNTIGLIGNINYNSANVQQAWHVDDVLTPTDEAYDLTQSVTPKWQYNLYLTGAHFITDSLSINLNAGFSTIDTKTTLSVHDGGRQTGNTAATSKSESHYLLGGLLGVGLGYFVTPSSSLDANLNYYIYASQELNNVSDIDTGGRDQLASRKLTLYIPTLLFDYTYHF